MDCFQTMMKLFGVTSPNELVSASCTAGNALEEYTIFSKYMRSAGGSDKRLLLFELFEANSKHLS